MFTNSVKLAKTTPMEFAMTLASRGVSFKAYEWAAATCMKKTIPIHVYLEMKGNIEPTLDALEIEMHYATTRYHLAKQAAA